MGSLTKLLLKNKLRCKNCRESAAIFDKNQWEVRGKYDGHAICYCKNCGHGLLMGVFSENHVGPDFFKSIGYFKKD